MKTDLPPEAYAAALASFPHMSIHRLGALLRHHPPDEAYAIASGEHRPAGLIERVLADPDISAAWRRAASAYLIDGVASFDTNGNGYVCAFEERGTRAYLGINALFLLGIADDKHVDD